MVSTPTLGKIYLGMYEAVRFLGEGGMGKVYLGRHRQTGQQVVIKVIHDHLAQKANVRRSFDREMQAMRRFRHPNAVALLDGALNGAGGPCLIMEYVRGKTVADLLPQLRRFPVDRTGRIVGQLCLVLHAAHATGLLHRDLAPANLMVVGPDTPREHIKVMDFGLARGCGFYVSLDQLQGQNVIEGGTPDYLCPEQIRGHEVDQRSDLYSVGAILYEMLTGKVPFADCHDTSTILRAHLERMPPCFAAQRVHDVPAAMERVVFQCLAKYPHERPGSARELLSLLEKALGYSLVEPETHTQPDQTPLPIAQGPDPHSILDSFQAWMPEQVAVMKLRGFVDGVGGKVLDSVPGLITVRVQEASPPSQESKSGWSFLARSKPKLRLEEPPSLTLELHLTKKQENGRNLVEIAVVSRPNGSRTITDRATRDGFAKRLCRELRAYLMIGR